MRLSKITIATGLAFVFLVSTIAPGISFAYGTSIVTIDKSSDEPTVLMTGFEPFDPYDVNPAQLIAESLDGQEIEGVRIVGISVPVDFNDSIAVVTQTIEQYDPVIVISIGLEARICLIHVEKVGVNLKQVPVDEGGWLRYRRIDPSGPFLRVSSLPTRCIAQAMRGEGVPARQSIYAGTYVCNSLLYGVLRYITKEDIPIKAGFIHVPLLSSQDPEKGMELEDMIEAVTIAISVSLKT